MTYDNFLKSKGLRWFSYLDPGQFNGNMSGYLEELFKELKWDEPISESEMLIEVADNSGGIHLKELTVFQQTLSLPESVTVYPGWMLGGIKFKWSHKTEKMELWLLDELDAQEKMRKAFEEKAEYLRQKQKEYQLKKRFDQAGLEKFLAEVLVEKKKELKQKLNNHPEIEELKQELTQKLKEEICLFLEALEKESIRLEQEQE